MLGRLHKMRSSMLPVVHGPGDDSSDVHVAAAQFPKSKPAWRDRPEGARTAQEATEFARAHEILIADEVEFVVGDALLRPDEFASYAGFRSNVSYRWEDLLLGGKLRVKVRSEVLASDEATLCVFTHEMHEINSLRRLFGELERIPGHRLIALTAPGISGNLHDQAWDMGDAAVDSFRRNR